MMKYSIVTCAYGNGDQFKNFLLTAMNQKCSFKYEVIVVDNGTPNSSIFDACYNFTVAEDRTSLGYMRIDPSEKKTNNITQGINMGARAAIGDYICIVADSNVLLSYNLLYRIDCFMNDKSVVTSTGCDYKISVDGTKQSEYSDDIDKVVINRKFLSILGWPQDPFNFNLDLVPYRQPGPHMTYDVYVVALDRINFLQDGGYDESETEWGIYHHKLVEKLCQKYIWKKLTGTKIVHQYHGLHHGKEIEPGIYSKQFEIMQCRRT